jgi:hypothetical protein
VWTPLPAPSLLSGAQRSVRDGDLVAQKIEFYLNIYFAICPLLKRRHGRGPLPADLQRALSASMAGFRTFLETRGAELSRTPEFLPYYALPYVPQPTEHPTFRELFMTPWLGELRGRVAKFFADTAPKGREPPPQIYGLLDRMAGGGPGSPSHAAVTKDLFEIAAQAVQALERVSPDEVGDMRERLQQVDERLVSLEGQSAQQPQEPQPGPRQQQPQQPPGRQSPAAAATPVPAAAAAPPPAAAPAAALAPAPPPAAAPAPEKQEQEQPQPQPQPQPPLPQDEQDRQLEQEHENAYDDAYANYGPDDVPPMGTSGFGGVAMGSPGGSSPGGGGGGGTNMGSVQEFGGGFGQSMMSSMGASTSRRGWAALDYGRIREVLLAAENRPEDAALLLQALRWRVIKTPAGKARRRALQSYLNGDVLGCTDSARGKEDRGGNLCTLLSGGSGGSHSLVVEQWARLVNCAASECSGRTYLLQHQSLVSTLCGILKREPTDNALRRNVLGALQKFSLRHEPQNEMIEAELIAWIVDALGGADVSGGGGGGDGEGLSDYSIEYGTALLMNLSLRPAGKRQAETVPTLAVLNALLEMDNPQVRTYVNGTLYSVLTRPALKEQVNQTTEPSVHITLLPFFW